MHIVDELASIRAQVARLQAREAEIKADLLSTNLPGDRIDGANFSATLVESDRESLDPAKVRELLGDRKFAACTRVTTSVSVRVKPRVVAQRAVEVA